MLKALATFFSITMAINWISYVAGLVFVLTDPSWTGIGLMALATAYTAAFAWFTFWLLESTSTDF
jgi:hypothetical protein